MVQGTAADIAIHAQEIMFLRKKLNEIYKQHTHQDLETLGELAVKTIRPDATLVVLCLHGLSPASIPFDSVQPALDRLILCAWAHCEIELELSNEKLNCSAFRFACCTCRCVQHLR